MMKVWETHAIFHSNTVCLVSRSSLCTTTGVTKAVVCANLSVGLCI